MKNIPAKTVSFGGIFIKEFVRKKLEEFKKDFSVELNEEGKDTYATGYGYVCKKCRIPAICEVRPWANLLIPVSMFCSGCGKKWNLFEKKEEGYEN